MVLRVRTLTRGLGKNHLDTGTVSYGFLGVPGPPGVLSKNVQRVLEVSRSPECSRKSKESMRKYETVRGSLRKIEEVRESLRKYENVRES